MKITQGCTLILLMGLLMTLPAMAGEEIYKWIDDDGVQRFSNVGAPEEVADYTVISARPAPQAQGLRDPYIEMIQEVREDLRVSDKERLLLQAARLEHMRMRTEAENKARMELACTRLQREIDALNRRAYSPFWTKGMRDHQIRQIETQLHALKYCR